MGATASSKAYIPTAPGSVTAEFGSAAPQVDTNVVEISLASLLDKHNETREPPIPCQECGAYLNSYSHVGIDGEFYLWNCEFCSHENRLEINVTKLPSLPEVTYVLEEAKNDAAVVEGDATTVIFCIDISGSMDATTSLEQPTMIMGKMTNIVSRLTCVKAAILSQLNIMQTETPNRKVGLVLFSSEVILIGDASSQQKIFNVASLEVPRLIQAVEGLYDSYFGLNVASSGARLSTAVTSLRTQGSTALGPALQMSVELASKGLPGSKVIICTDGAANVGVGSLNNLEVAQAFYEQVGERAAEKGVSVSVISLVGADCRLETLSVITDMTGGDITKVNPLNIEADFAEVLTDQVVATRVTATGNLHKVLKFRNEDEDNLLRGGSRLVRYIGNALQSASFTIEYTVKPQSEVDVDLSTLSKVPLQSAIEYTLVDGSKLVRVTTMLLDVTSNLEEAEEAVNVEILSRNVEFQSAKMAKAGRIASASSNVSHWEGYLVKNAKSEHAQVQVNSALSNMHQMQSALHVQIAEERKAGMDFNEHLMDARDLKKQRAKYTSDATVAQVHKMSKRKTKY
mmetsp:Transcript_24102/g.42789  ORF Transcript_24102/g.42789 Transcript_24102/m.42789 type:complete len:571 (-) Transcript_24102:1043-2755(-)|eukprot:CAMPEP_0204897756 /NCGR_PEP_ID=MMETSP1397-20131031/906_1 /ASSEMBLY_ACC=CAM_ASM_000891 /TAXON_ID=49980 /ORGANISM="Climacostomum Climacostomum virens, Strain Stock W-24" /LENGTH=570 /DNA_ID=CAMNT_0052065531 /DNA_START=17 /DNA_END=1729 /DNA_ORIENTATION=-